ncbi:MAG: polyphosphate kinase 1 [Bacteroidota bacterium]|nr:polyphosphate kinase 1 [Bacteroidota bacterium]
MSNTINAKSKFVNREISWLNFNERVLQEAADIKNPLIERFKFLGIFSNNLDEFFRVRVATISRIVNFKKKRYQIHGYTPKKILEEIDNIVHNQQARFEIIYQDISRNLESADIYIIDEKELTKSQGEWVKQYFHEQVRPNLFPIMIDSTVDFTALKDKLIYLVVHMSRKDNSIKENYALIKLPTGVLSRFFVLPKSNNANYIILLDDVIRYCLEDIFAIFNYDNFQAYTIKITRDAELDIDNDISKSFMEIISESLKQRQIGRAIRFVYDSSIPEKILKFITRKLNISNEEYLAPGGRYHNFKDFMNFPNIGSKSLENPIVKSLTHRQIFENSSILSEIKKKDIILHFPYQSFQYIIDLLREASIDPNVVSIKMTLYRVASKSNVINALINAARNGKKVTVFMEIQARFDEQANIEWANKMQADGINVIDSIPGMKVHCKLLHIRRKDKKGYTDYINFATGNYNEETAKVYSDTSLLTANKELAFEVDKIFDLFENNFKPYLFKHLAVSPLNMRKFFVNLINREIKNKEEGKEASIILKLNNLVDEDIINKLYKASQSGVKIKLIIRGICVLVPGIPNFSDNIEAISIVDKYLEHSRVLIFHNNGDPAFYISSADWMNRNFDYRIEAACPIYDNDIKQEIMDLINIHLNDNVKARIISKDNNNTYKQTDQKKKIRSQDEIYNYLKTKNLKLC